MRNKEVSQILYEIANLLSLGDENPFRIRAYEKAAQIIESIPEDIEDLYKTQKLKTIPGIGEGISEKISEYLTTNKLLYLEELRKKFPSGLLEIMNIPGMGPKKTKIIYEKLNIKTIDELKEAIKQHKLRTLDGFGEKTEKNILEGIQLKEKSKGRILLSDAIEISENIIDELKKYKEIKQISPAGSLRRKKETVGDIDILCTVETKKEKFIIDKFTQLNIVKKIIAKGTTKATILTKQDLQIDLRVVNPSCYGAAMQYFTGSKEHNIALRELANKIGLTINEYGVFKLTDNEKPIVGKTEEEVYKILSLQYIQPELRENRGEIELAQKNKLPLLIQPYDIKGDIHIHSKYSDGKNSIDEIVQKAQDMNYEWIIITDHSQGLKVANGTSISELYKKIDEIKKINKKTKTKILCGTEVDILYDGKLDYPDDVLKEVDFVICAIHTGFKQTQQQILERIKIAFQNKYVHAMSHPSGRLLNKRNPYKIDMNRVLEYAKEFGVALEINAFPDRLDLSDNYCKKAKEMGIKLTIGTDAHYVSQMEYMKFGLYVAQRGWLEKDNLINTLSYDNLVKFLKNRR